MIDQETIDSIDEEMVKCSMTVDAIGLRGGMKTVCVQRVFI